MAKSQLRSNKEAKKPKKEKPKVSLADANAAARLGGMPDKGKAGKK